jgi:hypothetical protein
VLHKFLAIDTHPFGAKVDFIFFNICVLIIDVFLPKGLDGELMFKKGCRETNRRRSAVEVVARFKSNVRRQKNRTLQCAKESRKYLSKPIFISYHVMCSLISFCCGVTRIYAYCF